MLRFLPILCSGVWILVTIGCFGYWNWVICRPLCDCHFNALLISLHRWILMALCKGRRRWGLYWSKCVCVWRRRISWGLRLSVRRSAQSFSLSLNRMKCRQAVSCFDCSIIILENYTLCILTSHNNIYFSDWQVAVKLISDDLAPIVLVLCMSCYVATYITLQETEKWKHIEVFWPYIQIWPYMYIHTHTHIYIYIYIYIYISVYTNNMCVCVYVWDVSVHTYIYIQHVGDFRIDIYVLSRFLGTIFQDWWMLWHYYYIKLCVHWPRCWSARLSQANLIYTKLLDYKHHG